MTTTETKSLFVSCMNKGFQMTFENGWTISVQWGIGNYCSRGRINELKSDTIISDMKEQIVSSPDCELMIWNGDDMDNVYDFGNNQVKGYCSTDEVGDWIYKVKNFPE